MIANIQVYVNAWHSKFYSKLVPGTAGYELYMNGQFDELPYIEYEKLLKEHHALS